MAPGSGQARTRGARRGEGYREGGAVHGFFINPSSVLGALEPGIALQLIGTVGTALLGALEWLAVAGLPLRSRSNGGAIGDPTRAKQANRL